MGKLFNYSTTGKRWVKLGFLGLCFDFYPSSYWKFMYMRINNAGVLFHPMGSITWPMKRLHKIELNHKSES